MSSANWAGAEGVRVEEGRIREEVYQTRSTFLPYVLLVGLVGNSPAMFALRILVLSWRKETSCSG